MHTADMQKLTTPANPQTSSMVLKSCLLPQHVEASLPITG